MYRYALITDGEITEFRVVYLYNTDLYNWLYRMTMMRASKMASTVVRNTHTRLRSCRYLERSCSGALALVEQEQGTDYVRLADVRSPIARTIVCTMQHMLLW
ncbi:hypothetical protein NDU88_007831 [Pleurodeles waltl]|uniref:Uncharacterized protein n=1 Tax=Pleurodeles waltl TaxID=8319 RepID=A0AAV7NU64_PLEWA|nr:hypothetical protein NDU88_007831 [Pleurodeles waltl]